MVRTSWDAILNNPYARRCILVTIIPSDDVTLNTPHPAKRPDAIRICTHTNVVVPVRQTFAGITEIPFWPLVKEWPDITYAIDVLERRGEPVRTELDIIQGAFTESELGLIGGTPSLIFRFDLWSDGIYLEDTLPLMVGRAKRSNISKDGSLIKIQITDAPKDHDVSYGNSKITRPEFPDAPDDVLDLRPRQTILGAFEFDIQAHQIDKFGQRFYLCDPPATVAPSRIRVNGIEVPPEKSPIAITKLTADTLTSYTEIVFPDTLENLGFPAGFVTCSGGVGVDPAATAPLLFLLETIGGYSITDQARSMAQTTAFQYSSFINSPGTILDILENRLMPQTSYILLKRYGMIDIIPTVGQVATWTLYVPHDLIEIEDTEETSPRTVFNDIEIFYGIDVSQSSVMNYKFRRSVVVNQDSDGDVGIRLGDSQRRYGKLPLTLKASDIVDQAVALQLAYDIAETHAFIHTIRTYLAPEKGYYVDLGYKIDVVDPSLGTIPSVVISKSFTSAGVVLKLMSLD